MNITALKVFYIILGAGLLFLASEPVAAQAGLGPVNRTVDRTLDRRLPRIEDRLEAELDRKAEEADQAADAVGEVPPAAVVADPAAVPANVTALGSNVASGIAGTVDTLAAGLRPLLVDIDPFGNAIEKDTLVVLLERDQVAALRAGGLAVLAERDMPGLGLALVTLRAAQGYDLAEKALELRKSFPGAAVDFNHLYRLQDGGSDGGLNDAADPLPSGGEPGAALRIGLIDSAVAPEHSSLQSVAVIAQDFVSHDAPRPRGHGTAVASVIAGASRSPVTLYAASVFFQAAGLAPGASTESLVSALDWLAAEEVDAINMSLAGPANSLLERALSRLVESHGPVVVAAVGNNGPAGEPMYPGAYDSVVGVTAVDRKQKVFRYANRGDHVDFAALGVNVKVANADGGWRLESGTSMAAPRVAVLAGQRYRSSAERGDELRAWLASNARDLGRPGFDPVFGYGLVTQPPETVSRVKTPPQD